MISLRSGEKSFQDLRIFKDLHLEFKTDTINCILGPSGCGKTTLLNCFAGLEDLDNGELQIDEKGRGMIFQEPVVLPWLTVKQNIMLPVEEFMKKQKPLNEPQALFIKSPAIEEINSIIDDLGLTEYLDFYPSQLSGGLNRRVSIARAMIYPAELLLMDEPFQGLDAPLKLSLIRSFYQAWKAHKKTVVLVTHDIEAALLMSERIVAFSDKPLQIRDDISIQSPVEIRSMKQRELLDASAALFSALTEGFSSLK